MVANRVVLKQFLPEFSSLSGYRWRCGAAFGSLPAGSPISLKYSCTWETYDIFTYNGTKLLASEHAAYNGSGGWSFTRFDGSSIAPVPTAVPEPTTMIAGALLLLPFGASTLRMLRRRTA